MIENLNPYPEYKDSGLPWLGEVPVHWEIRRNGGLFQHRNDSGDNELPILEVSLRTGVQVRDFATSKRKQVMTDRSKYKRAGQGDLVYNMMRMWQGAAGIAPVSGLVSPAYVVCRALPGIDSGYFSRLFKTDDYLAEIDAASRGIVKDRNRLYWDQFKQIFSPLPPANEQAAIARFLAWATNRLDRAIEAKRRIIALLQEQKQAIIHRAVTRGLDPSMPLKDSGISWLGEIPEHWEVRKLKYLSPQVTVGIVIQPARLYASNGVPALRSLNISSGTISTNQLVHISEEGHLANSKSQLREGDVVVVRTGRTGIAVIIPPELDGSNCIDLLVVRKAKELLSEYLLMYLSSCAAKEDISTHSVGAIQSHYNTSTLANLRIPLPPTNEQRLLLLECDSKIAPIHTAISRLEREITLLRDYRTRLIADVVTGKLDVREVAKGLPEEDPQDQPDVAAGCDADEAEDDAETDLIDKMED